MEDRDMEQALRGLDYPAPRNKLVTTAMENSAPREVIARLLELPETADFQNQAELRDALGVDVPAERPQSGWQ